MAILELWQDLAKQKPEVIETWIDYNNYNVSEDFVEDCMYMFLDINPFIKYSEQELKAVKILMSYLNVETLKHSIACVKFAELLTENISNTEFKKCYGISRKNFYLGMIIHDIGKTLIPKYILETDRILTDDERKFITVIHSSFAKKTLKTILEKESFSEDSVNIALYHHGGSSLNYVSFAKVIDITEALMSARCYKKALNKEIVLKILDKNIQDGIIESKYAFLVKKFFTKLEFCEKNYEEIFKSSLIIEYYNNYKEGILEKPHHNIFAIKTIAEKKKDIEVLMKLEKEFKKEEV